MSLRPIARLSPSESLPPLSALAHFDCLCDPPPPYKEEAAQEEEGSLRGRLVEFGDELERQLAEFMACSDAGWIEHGTYSEGSDMGWAAVKNIARYAWDIMSDLEARADEDWAEELWRDAYETYSRAEVFPFASMFKELKMEHWSSTSSDKLALPPHKHDTFVKYFERTIAMPSDVATKACEAYGRLEEKVNDTREIEGLEAWGGMLHEAGKWIKGKECNAGRLQSDMASVLTKSFEHVHELCREQTQKWLPVLNTQRLKHGVNFICKELAPPRDKNKEYTRQVENILQIGEPKDGTAARGLAENQRQKFNELLERFRSYENEIATELNCAE